MKKICGNCSNIYKRVVSFTSGQRQKRWKDIYKRLKFVSLNVLRIKINQTRFVVRPGILLSLYHYAIIIHFFVTWKVWNDNYFGANSSQKFVPALISTEVSSKCDSWTVYILNSALFSYAAVRSNMLTKHRVRNLKNKNQKLF